MQAAKSMLSHRLGHGCIHEVHMVSGTSEGTGARLSLRCSRRSSGSQHITKLAVGAMAFVFQHRAHHCTHPAPLTRSLTLRHFGFARHLLSGDVSCHCGDAAPALDSNKNQVHHICSHQSALSAVTLEPHAPLTRTSSFLDRN